MIKVLQVYDSFSISSGISSVVMSWYRNIDKSEIDMDFLACWHKEPSYEKEILNGGNKIYYIENTNTIDNYFSFIRNVDYFFKEHASTYDVIHLHSAIFSFPILYYAKKYGIKTRIVHVHSSSLGNTKLSSLRNRICLYPMKFLSTNFIACSKEAARLWFESVKIKNYHILNNGLNTIIYKKNLIKRNELRKLWNIQDDEFLLGHISNMTPIKNVPFLIEILNILIKDNRKAKLVLIGKSELPDNVLSLIRQYKLGDYIVNIGVRNDIYDCIQTFDLCLMPSQIEGYGLVPIEVQLAEKTVLISNGFPEIIKETPLAIVIDIKLDKWVSYIEEMIDNKDYMINKFDVEFYNKFDIKRISNELINLYKLYEVSTNERYKNT